MSKKPCTPKRLKATLAALGFAPPTSDLVAPFRCGIYVLHLSDARYYVGQSIDLHGRLATHQRMFPDIEQVSFLKVRRHKTELDGQEIATIQALERQCCALLNIVHVSITHQSSPFDDLVTPDEQQHWLADPARIGKGIRPAVDPSVRLKQAAKLARLRRRADADAIIACLRQYVAMCLPKPASTESAYWSVSCLPSTNAHSAPRIACFNSNTMEIFVVGHVKGAPSHIWAFLNVSAKGFAQAYRSLKRFNAVHPDATVERLGYATAGHDQITIAVAGLEVLEQLLTDPGILAAARLFNLHLMRRRTNFYARYHCYDLADHLLGLKAARRAG
ncbi:MAG: hypothetical protein EI684_09980 [Candidatus Viridilinea halotolerans]|uniref:GIY-YIG nuclease family protein n=1 Tax=Candidatus Viridilinea halotolerans TaxID=2491704 RepID=A0A426U0L9_9CHLR|nr:MAG: hypothetical protein EI684_09980 [Candidatus Viridilinea halotolerans]